MLLLIPEQKKRKHHPVPGTPKKNPHPAPPKRSNNRPDSAPLRRFHRVPLRSPVDVGWVVIYTPPCHAKVFLFRMYLKIRGLNNNPLLVELESTHSNFGFFGEPPHILVLLGQKGQSLSNTRYIYYKPQIIITDNPGNQHLTVKILSTLAVRIRVFSVFSGRLRLPELSLAAMKRNTGGCVCDMDSLGIWRDVYKYVPYMIFFYMYLKSIQTRRKKVRGWRTMKYKLK